MKDLTTTRKVKTVSDLMIDLESEIEDIKSGKLAENKARIVSTYRRMQLRTVEIYLSAVRLERKLLPGLGTRIGELPPAGESAQSVKALRTKSRGEAPA